MNKVIQRYISDGIKVLDRMEKDSRRGNALSH